MECRLEVFTGGLFCAKVSYNSPDCVADFDAFQGKFYELFEAKLSKENFLEQFFYCCMLRRLDFSFEEKAVSTL